MSGVAIVCAHFSPEVGYQEVDLARAFARLGERVRVITSTEVSPNARSIVRSGYEPGRRVHDGYELVRVRPRVTLGPNVIGRGIEAAVAEFSPEHVILIGPGKLFGVELFSARPRPWRRIAVVQDNSEAGGAAGGAARALAHRLVKRPTYRLVVRHADRVVLNVPETRTLIEPWLGARERARLARTALELRLGFDPERFFFSAGERGEWRARHSIADEELLVATCTRVTPNKGLEQAVDAVSALRSRGVPVRYILAGMLDDEYGRRLRAHVATQREPAAFLLLPALAHDEMRQLFAGCDVGVWTQAAITIQQGLGTGLPVVLRRTPTVSHLLDPGRTGWYVEPGEPLADAIGRALAAVRPEERPALAEQNRGYLGYDVLATEMLAGL